MPAESSFDIVSEYDTQEMVNAVDQTKREVQTRYDLKDTKTDIELSEKELIITTETEMHMTAIRDILLSKECFLGSGETAGTLHDRLADLAPEALEEALLLIRAGCAPRIRQDDTAATYAPKLSRAIGRLDWSRSAVELERIVRGLHPWPGCTAELETAQGRRVEIKVHRAMVGPGPADPAELHLPCGGGGVLELLEVQPSGGKRMSKAEFVRGHKILRTVAGEV